VERIQQEERIKLRHFIKSKRPPHPHACAFHGRFALPDLFYPAFLPALHPNSPYSDALQVLWRLFLMIASAFLPRRSQRGRAATELGISPVKTRSRKGKNISELGVLGALA